MARSTQATVDEAQLLDESALDPPSTVGSTRSPRLVVLAGLVAVIAGWLLLTSGEEAGQSAAEPPSGDADGLFEQRRVDQVPTNDPAARPGYWEWTELLAPDGTTAVIPIPEGYLAVGLVGDETEVWLSVDGVEWELSGRQAGGFSALSATPRLTVAVTADATGIEFSVDDGATFSALRLASPDDLSITPWLEPAADLARRGPAFSVRISNPDVISVLAPIAVDLADHRLSVDPLRDRFEIGSADGTELLTSGSLSELRNLFFRPDTEPLADGLLGDPWGDGEWFVVMDDRRLGSFTDQQWDRAAAVAGYDLRAGRWGALATSPFVATTTDGEQWLEAPLSLALGAPVSFVDLHLSQNRAVIEAQDVSVRLDALLIAGSGAGPSRWFVTQVRDNTFLQGSNSIN